MAEPAEKICARCGRRITPRKRWARNFHLVRYCSKACRRARPHRRDHDLERAILDLLAERAAGATICLSEAARRATGDRWRNHLQDTRASARRLVARGQLEITQQGRVVDPSTARGAIRLRLPRGARA